MSTKLIFFLLITIADLNISTFAQDGMSKSYGESNADEIINQDTRKKAIELITKLVTGMEGKPEMNGKIVNKTKFEMNKNIGKIKDNNDSDEIDLKNSQKLFVRDLIIELKKQLAKKEPALSLYGAVQRATGDFWIAAVNTIRTINNFADVLLGSILAGLQRQPMN